MTPSTSAPDPQALAALPHVFVDRSLGAVQLPRILRDAGVRLTTMREHYGEQIGQLTVDPDWITLVAERGWIGSRAATRPGPYIYGVYPHEITQLPLH